MAAGNSALQQLIDPGNLLGSDCQNCRMHMVGDTGQEDCLMEVIRSQWTAPFGDTSYCKHPAAKQFVNFINSNQP